MESRLGISVFFYFNYLKLKGKSNLHNEKLSNKVKGVTWIHIYIMIIDDSVGRGGEPKNHFCGCKPNQKK